MVGRLTDVYQGSLSRKAYNRPPGEFFGRPSFEPTNTNPGLPGNGGYPGNVDFRPPPSVDPRRPVVNTPAGFFPKDFPTDPRSTPDVSTPGLPTDTNPGLPGNGGYPGNVDPIRPPSSVLEGGEARDLTGILGPLLGGLNQLPNPGLPTDTNPGFGPGLPGNGGYPGNVDFRPHEPSFGGGGSNGGIQSLLSPLFSGLRDFQQQKFEPYAKQVTQLTNQTFPDYTSGSIGSGFSSATPFGGLGNLGVRPFSI